MGSGASEDIGREECGDVEQTAVTVQSHHQHCYWHDDTVRPSSSLTRFAKFYPRH